MLVFKTQSLSSSGSAVLRSAKAQSRSCHPEEVQSFAMRRLRARAVILRKCSPSQREGLPTKDLCTFRIILMPHEPRLAQILPFRIHRHDQRYFLNAQEPFNLLLASDRSMCIPEALKINQPVDPVPRSEFPLDTLLVLEHASPQIPRRLGAIRYYVNVIEARSGIHGFFVGSPSRCEGLHFLRMTAGWEFCQ